MVDDKEVGVRQMPTVRLELIWLVVWMIPIKGTGDDYKYPSYFDAVIEEAKENLWLE